MKQLAALSIEDFQRIIVRAGLVAILLAAWFSAGYHHPDEHFQIIEFCNYKMGNIQAEELAWEYPAKLRPGLPVLLCFGLFSGLKFIGISNPFLLTFFLRLFTGLIAWFVLKKIAAVLIHEFKTESGKKIFLLLIFFLWCTPYLNVRYSSENQSAISLLGALFLIISYFRTNPKSWQYLLFAGFLAGLSFFFRFTMGFALVGLGAWLIFIQRPNLKQWLLLFAGGILSLFLCVTADYWLYQAWTVTPINYFTTNVVNDVASTFGVSPWWYYFHFAFFQLIPPISLVLLIFFFSGYIKLLKHPVIWIMTPFILAHFITPHKELRFLFPIAVLFFFVVSYGIDSFINHGKYPKLGKIVLVILITINIPVLLYKTFAPALELVLYYKFLSSYEPERQHTLFCMESDIYVTYPLHLDFYKPKNMTREVILDEKGLLDYLALHQPDEVLLLERKLFSGMEYPGYSEKTLYTLIPEWVSDININNWVERSRLWKIKLLTRKGR